VELIRAGQQLEAIAYARRHLAPWAPQYMPELQQAATLLTFQAGLEIEPYKQLLDNARVGQWVGMWAGVGQRWARCSGTCCVEVLRGA
jgi:hypothetical protein